jgi:hypothetical protein
MRALVALCALLASGCSPLIGLIVRALESGGSSGAISVGTPVSGSTVGASDDWQPPCGAAQGGGDRSYAFVPPRTGTYRIDVNGAYDCLVAIYDERAQPIACNDDAGAQTHSLIEQSLEANHRYTIVVDGFQGARGTFTLVVTPITPSVAPPPAALVLAPDARSQGNTTGQSDHRTPPCGSAPGTADQVWTLTPTTAGVYEVVVEAAYDSVLAVYRAGSDNALACNDNNGSSRISRVEVPLEAGQSYEVVVDGYHGVSGAYAILAHMTQSSARVLNVGPPVSGDTRGQPNARASACGSDAPDQAWTFTPPRDGAYQFHLDANYDAVLAIFAAGASAPLACNDDFRGGAASRLVARMQAGTAYEIVADGYGSESGLYVLRALPAGFPMRALTLSRSVTGNTTVAGDTRTPSCGSAVGTPDDTWSFVPTVDGTYRFDVQAGYDAVLALYQDGREVSCNDDFENEHASRIEAPLHAGAPVELLVDGSADAQGPYRMSVSAIATSGSEDSAALERRCASAPPLPIGRSTIAIAAATAHATPSCARTSGGEAVYRLDVQQPSRLTMTALSPLTPILELRVGCSQAHTVAACDASGRASIQAHVVPGTTYVVIVDSAQTADGAVTIEAQLAPENAPF